MRFRVAAVFCLSLFLAGCAMTPTAAPSTSAGVAIQGTVHGGQQPLAGAHVFLFAANTTGYGGSGIAASSSNASLSLLQSAANTLQDRNSSDATYGDYYVTTDNSGQFTITGDYSCTPGQQVYAYSLGGNPTYPSGSVNASAGLLAILGNCPAAGNFLTATPYVEINEVSTIAAAYSFAGFASDAIHVSSSGTALAQTGIANAFLNAANMVTLGTGTALATTPAGNGTVPQSTINTLADILAACVNSTGGVSGPTNPTSCYTLFNNAQSAGSSGTVPIETATAAINIAHNPGSNVTALFGSPAPSSPFQPALSSQPNDFVLSLLFEGGGIGDPERIAIDGGGNVWTTNGTGTYPITKQLPSGALASGSPFSTGFASGYANAIAIDESENVWVANGYSGELAELSNAGAAVSGSPFTTSVTNGLMGLAIDGGGDPWVSALTGVSQLSTSGGSLLSFPSSGNPSPVGIAIDTSGNAWVLNYQSVSIAKDLSGGGAAGGSPFIGGGLPTSPCCTATGNIAIDASGHVWATTLGEGVSEFYSDGSPVLASPYTSGGTKGGYGLAIDGAGAVWSGNYPNGHGFSELSNSGSPVAGSPLMGTYGGSASPYALAIDGSGNVWSANISGGVIEWVGAATPVVTPLAAGVKNNMLGTRP
jgi:hypothetical protein